MHAIQMVQVIFQTNFPPFCKFSLGFIPFLFRLF